MNISLCPCPRSVCNVLQLFQVCHYYPELDLLYLSMVGYLLFQLLKEYLVSFAYYISY